MMSGSKGMDSIRRLLVVSTQDSTQLSSWSNIPYLFCQTLEAQGVEVLRLTLNESSFLRFATRIVQKFLELVGMGKSTWSFSRSALYYLQAQRQIDRALGMQEVDGVLVLSFSYGPSLPLKQPLYLFGDWSLAYTIACQREREPRRLERGSIQRENKLIQSASHVFVLFPLAEKFIKKTLPKANTHYLGNVINAVEQPQEQDISNKSHSLSLLFVGKPHYIEGARQLIEAYQKLKPRFQGISLDIVGMRAEHFTELPEGVVCHGYLDKGDRKQREHYYSLLRKAKLFVNPNPRWASFSAALEAMYFYTPLVTSAYAEMEETFGLNLSFGSYYRDGHGPTLDVLIAALLTDPNYELKARNAHCKAKQFSWHEYVSSFFKIIHQSDAVTESLK